MVISVMHPTITINNYIIQSVYQILILLQMYELLWFEIAGTGCT